MTAADKRERRKLRHDLQNKVQRGMSSVYSFGKILSPAQIKQCARMAVDRYISSEMSK